MIDAKIENGDTVVDSSGNVVMISDSDALFQRAVMCISLPRQTMPRKGICTEPNSSATDNASW